MASAGVAIARLDQIPASDLMSFQLESPGWGETIGYVLDRASRTLYCKVPKELQDKLPCAVTVLVFAGPYQKFVVTGQLASAASVEEAEAWKSLAIAAGFSEKNATYMTIDARSGKPRKNNGKLVVTDIKPA